MIAELHIQAAWRNGKTILKNSFCSHPFKLADITEDKNGRILHLMLMSSSPGILDNDHYKIRIELDEECCIKFKTQSYQRLFQMKTGAQQEMQVIMKKASSFIFLPHPSVPHNASIFSARNKFHLSEDCFLIWGEILTCGRKLSGEMFLFSKYHSQTEIYVLDKLIMKENLLVVPAISNMNAIGQLEGYTHQASFTCICCNLSNTSVIEGIHDILLQEKDVCFGISALSNHGFTVRLLGYRAEQLHDTLQMIADYLTALPKTEELTKGTSYAK
jgi:urease accessory protein